MTLVWLVLVLLIILQDCMDDFLLNFTSVLVSATALHPQARHLWPNAPLLCGPPLTLQPPCATIKVLHLSLQPSRQLNLRMFSSVGVQQERWYVPSGLWAQHRSNIAAMAKQGGFNCIRLVWSLEMALKTADGAVMFVPNQTLALKANPDLMGKNPLQVFDAVVRAVTQQVRRGIHLSCPDPAPC